MHCQLHWLSEAWQVNQCAQGVDQSNAIATTTEDGRTASKQFDRII
jgi:hypothetical protein